MWILEITITLNLLNETLGNQHRISEVITL
jgi:hypothetical protein